MIGVQDLLSIYLYHSYRLQKRKNKALPSRKMAIILTKTCFCGSKYCNVIVSAIILFYFVILRNIVQKDCQLLANNWHHVFDIRCPILVIHLLRWYLRWNLIKKWLYRMYSVFHLNWIFWTALKDAVRLQNK